ncbi:PucR family transcriptional regulator [Amycolatopsis kentuckyensis]|uniref:PucR family transcriptional regulator n=1 Tax=Amycolatopsis kentuckyensis TaxID=218823 RepID=UPI001178A8D9|nr:PucR family transcriptional regulator [Amycolatopsis kentuckyensis]
MTVLDERPNRRARPGDDFLTGSADDLLAAVTPEGARPAASALLDEAADAYRRILGGGAGPTAARRARVRIAGQAFAEAGGTPDLAADLLGRFAALVVDAVAPHQVVSVVQVAHLLVRDLLAGACGPVATAPSRAARCAIVQRLVRGEQLAPEDIAGLEAEYVVLAARFPQPVPHDRLAALLDEHHDDGMLGAAIGDGVFVLVPRRLERRITPLLGVLAGRFGQAPWTTTVPGPRAGLVAACREAADVLKLVAAAGRPPGPYRLDDVVLEHAVVRDPVSSARLLALINPLAGNEVLHGTLATLVRTDFNRTLAARALFIHRSTLDYRIRRIEEITGQNPLTSRGAHVLAAAMVVHAVAGS